MNTLPNWTPKAILFDLDGTLINSDDVAVSSLAAKLDPVLGERALTVARNLWMAAETPGNAFITLLDWLGLDDEVFAIKHALTHWQNPEVEPTFSIIDGVEPMLLALAQTYKLAIVTTRGSATIDQFLAAYPTLAPLFATTIGADDTERLKPHPEPILLAAQQLGVHPEACVMVGDTSVDMRSARRAGAWRVGVLCGFGERDELMRAGANMVLGSTAECVDIF